MTREILYLQRHKLTILLVLTNVITFLGYGLRDFDIIDILELGANFAPYTLDDQYWRLVTSMFLHGNIWHIAINMFSLFQLGTMAERKLGWIRFGSIYFITGLAAGLASVQFNLFTISVGASGAIFGLYGYSIIESLEKGEKHERRSIILNFVIYMCLMYAVGTAINFDNAGHFGGVLMGMTIRLAERYLSFIPLKNMAWFALVVSVYFVLPRHQLQYFQAYQYFIDAENKILAGFNSNVADQVFLEKMEAIQSLPDTVSARFRSVDYIPEALTADTAWTHRFMLLRQGQINFLIRGLRQESFIYIDSVQELTGKIMALNPPLYPLNFSAKEADPDSTESKPPPNIMRQGYDEHWVETNAFNPTYYRLGEIDSLGEWHGQVEDHYASGAIQMKGRLWHGLKQGIFTYYTEDSTFSSGGRYYQDDHIGKWEEYHANGQLLNEVRYENGRGYMENTWDSLGNTVVVNRQGVIEYRFDNGLLDFRRSVKDGVSDGFVESYYPNGKLRFKEYYEYGDFISGLAYSPDGGKHTYDVSGLIPFPKGGLEKFYDYVHEKNLLVTDTAELTVHLRFDVRHTGEIVNIRFLRRSGEPYDSFSKQLLLDGPAWEPAMRQGYIPMNSYGEVIVNF